MSSYPQPAEIAVFAAWMAYAMWMARRMEKSAVDPHSASQSGSGLDD